MRAIFFYLGQKKIFKAFILKGVIKQIACYEGSHPRYLTINKSTETRPERGVSVRRVVRGIRVGRGEMKGEEK